MFKYMIAAEHIEISLSQKTYRQSLGQPVYTNFNFKKADVDPGTLPQLRWRSVWQSYLICF